jgi:hypothetical protein
MNNMKRWGWIILLQVLCNSLFAQNIKVHGTVRDAATGEGLPFVNLLIKGQPQIATTDTLGKYRISVRALSDSIFTAYVGYQRKAMPLSSSDDQVIDFSLTAEHTEIAEIIIKPGENPAHIVLRKIIAHKSYNNLKKLGGYQYESYNKVQVDLVNPEKLQERKIMKPFDFVFENMDSSELTGKVHLPLLLSESVAEYLCFNDPLREKETIKASRISGTQNESFAIFTGKLYQKLNLYDNYMPVFETPFVSPIADFGLRFYKYHMMDTLVENGHSYFHISFTAKRKQEKTFNGEMWVADTTFALWKVDMSMAADANINFIKNLHLTNEYVLVNDSLWFPSMEKMYAEFTLPELKTGFFGIKTSYYRHIQVNPVLDTLQTAFSNDIQVIKGAGHKPDEYWNINRPSELNSSETSIYAMVDSVQKVPLFKTAYDLSNLLYSYYYVKGKFEYGPYYTTYSFNPIEGNRFRFGGRTSNEFSTNLMLFGHLAYGTADERFKYGAGFLYMLGKAPRSSFTMSYDDDIENLGQSSNAFLADNILSSILRTSPNYKLTYYKQFRTSFEKEWFPGLSNTFMITIKNMYPTRYVPFTLENGSITVPIPHISTVEIAINTRFAYKEKYLAGEFERTSLGTVYPIVNFDISGSPGASMGSDYRYMKLHLNVTDWFDVGTWGYTKYVLDAGKTFGHLPYPLLQLHAGNETYAFDPFSFNMMNYYEFVSDQYASLFAEHHFQGLFFNHVPLLRKLKWREVISAKGLIGTLDPANALLMQFPDGLTDVSRGYLECGAGIENIFRVIRIQAMWRFTYLGHPNVSPLGIRVALQLSI